MAKWVFSLEIPPHTPLSYRPLSEGRTRSKSRGESRPRRIAVLARFVLNRPDKDSVASASITADDVAETDDGGADGEPYELRAFAGDEGTCSVVDVIPTGAICVVALIEHRWAIPLRDAIHKTGGRTLADAWIDPDDPVLGRLG